MSVQGTPSTKVTPDPKHTCGVVPAEPVQPVKLAFDDAAGNGTGGVAPPTERGRERETITDYTHIYMYIYIYIYMYIYIYTYTYIYIYIYIYI